MNYHKLIGYSIETNQASRMAIKNVKEAEQIVDEIIQIYTSTMLKQIKLTDKLFTAYTYHYPNSLRSSISLWVFLRG